MSIRQRIKTNVIVVGLLLSVINGSCTDRNVHDISTRSEDLYLLVDPFIGTGGHGHTFPGASSPHGMVQLSPDTRWEGWDACSGYHHDDDSIYGFSHTHLSGTGCSDLSDVLFIPTTDADLYRDSITRTSLPSQPFTHADEEAHAGYYAVHLRSGIRAELTTTPLVGAHKYTFPKGTERHIVIDLVSFKHERMKGAALQIHSDTEVSGLQITDGWVEDQHIYFYARFSAPIMDAELYLDGKLHPETRIEGDSVRGLFTFGQGEAPIEVYVGLSQTSVEAAKANLLHDLNAVSTNTSFDDLRKSNEESWNAELSKINIPRGNADDLKIFYTAFYHALLTPNRTSDVEGTYRGMDNQTHQTQDGHMSYSTFSLWDTYRALHPLMTLIDHSQVREYVISMMDMYDQSGELPIWPLASGETRTMIGYHAVSVIADAYLRGIMEGIDMDKHKVLEAMITSSLINRKGALEYSEYGMIPANRRNESVSCTLEYSYDDWCIAQMAKLVGDTAVYHTYSSRAQNFVHLFDGSTLFFRGRNEDGSWGSDFNAYDVSKDFTEANAWQYRFAPVHDIYGLQNLYGSKDKLIEALDALFADHPDAPKIDLQDITGMVGQYAHGNEPSHHIAYLYNYVGEPWKTQELTRRLLAGQYSAAPDGISGNEDCGQMSAWYLFSAIGMYPVTPGSGEYVLTTPLFEEVVMTMANGHTLHITANDPHKNHYIKSVSLNGRVLDRLYVTYEELMMGGDLTFELCTEPNREVAALTPPYSQTTIPKPSPVYASDDLSLFDESVTFELKSATPSATIYYTLDGSEPDASSSRYHDPLTVTESTTIRAVAYQDNRKGTPVTLYATRAVYHEPIGISRTTEGVRYALYSGRVDSTKDIPTHTKLVKSGITPDVNIDFRTQEDDFAIIFSGYINIPETDVYEFQLTSDDGSVLSIWGQPIVLNDGSHAYVSATGKMALAQGYHPFELRYWQGSEGKGLRLLMRRRGEHEYYSPKYQSLNIKTR